MRIALFQPDIPQNVGAILRIAACFEASLDIIEPCGFPFDDRRIRRSGMDYIEHVDIIRHESWEKFRKLNHDRRIVLFTTKTDKMLNDFVFNSSDIMLFGRESAGVTDDVHAEAGERVKIPISEKARSLNLATAVSIAAWDFVNSAHK